MNYTKLPYASASLITNLLTNVDGYDESSDLTVSACANADAKIEKLTNKIFSPVRKQVVQTYQHSEDIFVPGPIITINSLKIGNKAFSDADLIVDRNTGMITFPFQSYWAPDYRSPLFYAPQVVIDYIKGYSELVFDEVLSTSDNLTYTFSNPALSYTVPLTNSQYPLVSLAGTPVTNFITNSDSTGITSITFSESVSGIVTATYPTYSVPIEIVEAATKIAAIEILTSFALTNGYSVGAYQGTQQIQMDSSYINYGNGQFSKQIAKWQAEIDAVVAIYRSVPIGGIY